MREGNVSQKRHYPPFQLHAEPTDEPWDPEEIFAIQTALSIFRQRGLIQRSRSEWSFNCLATRDDEGVLGFYVDYSGMEKLLAGRSIVQIPPASHFPTMVAKFAEKHPKSLYSVIKLKLDHCSWPLPLDVLSADKTAFSAPDGSLYEWTVLPFDFPDSLKQMHGYIENLIRDIGIKNWAVRICEILILSITKQENLTDTEKVFERLSEVGMKPEWSVNSCQCNK